MPFHVRDEETDAMVRQLARVKGLGLTEAIKRAVRRELSLESDAIPLRQRVAALRAELNAWPKTGLEADKAFFDALSGEP